MGYDPQTIQRMLEGDLKETKLRGMPWSPRELMISLGEDWGRHSLTTDFWCRVAAPLMDFYLKQGCRVCFDDLRYTNEYEMLRLSQAYFIRIKRGVDATGPAEGLLKGKDFKWSYANEGTLADFEAAIASHFGQLMYEQEQGVVQHGSEG